MSPPGLLAGLPDVPHCPALLPVLEQPQPGQLQPLLQQGRGEGQALLPLLPPGGGVLGVPHQSCHAVVHGPGDGDLLSPSHQHWQQEHEQERHLCTVLCTIRGARQSRKIYCRASGSYQSRHFTFEYLSIFHLYISIHTLHNIRLPINNIREDTFSKAT